MYAKKGQIVWFVISGVFIMILFFLIFWLFSSLKQTSAKEITTEEEFQNIKNFVLSCEQGIAEEAITILGRQGGRIYPENYLEINRNRIEYSYYNNMITLPNIEAMQKEAERYINNKMFQLCNPSNATERNVTRSRITTQVKMNYDNILIETRWPITVFFDNNTQKSFESIKFQMPIRMLRIYEAVRRDLENPFETNLDYIETFDKMDFKKIKHKQDILNVIIDHNSEAKNKPYRFFYAIKT